MKKSVKLICAVLIISLLAIPMTSCAKPLVVSFYEPKDKAIVSASTIQVRGYISDPKATVWLNDYEMTLSKSSRSATFATALELMEGENVITVTAARGKPDKWKDVVARTVTVTYKPQ